MHTSFPQTAPRIAIKLLGQFEVRHPGATAPVDLKSKKGRALLAYLALHLDRPVPRSRVAALLWEDGPEEAGRHSLRQLLTKLRDEIGVELDNGISKEAIRLESRYLDVDAVSFLKHCENAVNFPTAVSLYAGDLADDLEIGSLKFDEWILIQRQHLHSIALKVFDGHVRALQQLGQSENAFSVCERLFALDPLRESSHRLLLELEAKVNGRNSALVRAEKLTALLRDQLSVLPEPATQRLISQLANYSTMSPTDSTAETVVSGAMATLEKPRFRHYLILATSIASACAVGLGAWYFSSSAGNIDPQVSSPGPKNPVMIRTPETSYSIAVIPFTSRIDSPDVRRFMRALEEDVIDNLARVPRFLVISRQTSRAYLNTDKDAKQIGGELNVSFLLSANIDSDGEKLVIRTQLTDTQSGLQVWAGRFNFKLGAKYDVFEEIVLGVARQFQVQVWFSEANKRISAERENPSYGDLIQRAWAESFRAFAKHENTDRALELFEKAIALNPDYASAHIGIAGVLIRRAGELRSPNQNSDLQRAENTLLAVLKEQPFHGTANNLLGIVYKLRGRIAESLVQFTKAVEINPSNPNAHAHLGHTLIILDRAEEARSHILKAIRLSPQDPMVSAWLLFAGLAELHVRRYDEAIRWIELSAEGYARSARTQMYLAAAYMLRGQQRPGIEAAKRALKELPHLEADNLFGAMQDASPVYLAERDRVLQAMREALRLARVEAE